MAACYRDRSLSVLSGIKALGNCAGTSLPALPGPPSAEGSWGKPGELDRHAPILALALTSCPPQQIILAPPPILEEL